MKINKTILCIFLFLAILFGTSYNSFNVFAETDLDKVEAQMGFEKQNDSDAEDANGNLVINMIGMEKKDTTKVWNDIYDQYKYVIALVTGLAALTMFAIFLLGFMRLGATAGNPQERSHAITTLIWSGIATVGLGGVSIFFAFFYNMLSGVTLT